MMKKFLSTSYPDWAFNTGTLLLRITLGVLMMHHGYQKLINFGTLKNNFVSILGMGSTVSLTMDVFAEFFCALFILIGLFTRLAAIPLIIAMGVALYKAHNMDVFNQGEMASLYLAGFTLLLLTGPGRVSVDSMIGK